MKDTDNKDWNVINDGAYGQVFEKKDGSVIITATWDGKGFKYTSHYPPKPLNEDTVASYDGVYFKTKQGERLYSKQEVDDMIKEAKTDTVVEAKIPTVKMGDMETYMNGYQAGVYFCQKYGVPEMMPQAPEKLYNQSEVDAIREELGFAICYLKAFVDLNKGGIKADETSKDAQKIIDNYEAKHKPLTKDKGKDSKEWEIVQFSQKDGSTLWVGKNIYGCWYIYDKVLRRNFDRDEKWMIENGYPIHSVKRLSDNEVFTVDGWFSNNGGGIYTEEKIEKFEVVGNTMRVYSVGELGHYLIKDITKLTHPTLEKVSTDNSDVLFTTEDGVDVKHFDDCWCVRDNCNTPIKWTRVIKTGMKKDEKYFSTKAAADNYIKCNEKLLSFNDVWNLSKNKSTDNAYVVISKSDLTKIVKEKLKTHTP